MAHVEVLVICAASNRAADVAIKSPPIPANCRVRDNSRVNPNRLPPDGGASTRSYRLDLLRELPAAAAEAMRRQGTRRRHLDGTTLVQRGQAMKSVLVLMRGKLRSVTSLPDGREHLIRWIEPGEAIGVASALAGLPFQADLIASGRCEVLAIPGDAVVEAMRRDAEVGLAVARLLAGRLSEVLDHVAAQAQGRLRDRVQAALRHLAAENGEQLADGRTRLRISQQDISDAVGASRQRVNEALRSLQRAGHVEIGYRQITLVSPKQHPLGSGTTETAGPTT
jgi:CRP-like cAMP-binding protein